MIADGDRVVRQTYQQLRRDGLNHSEARAEIARALLGVWWEVGYGITPDHDGTPRFHAVLRRISHGERAADIWPD
jgi:hypothetical protein